jgi:hypothetical protein
VSRGTLPAEQPSPKVLLNSKRLTNTPVRAIVSVLK